MVHKFSFWIDDINIITLPKLVTSMLELLLPIKSQKLHCIAIWLIFREIYQRTTLVGIITSYQHGTRELLVKMLPLCYWIMVSIATLPEKCPYSELFWSALSRIWTEYGEIRSIFPYSGRMLENANQSNSE